MVVLRGSVPTLADALRARSLARNVPGVGLVDTRFHLATRSRSDRDIEFDLRQRFLSNGDLAHADLGITVRSGAVLLTGRVDDMRVRDLTPDHLITRALVDNGIPVLMGSARSVRPDPGRAIDESLLVTPLLRTSDVPVRNPPSSWGEADYRQAGPHAYDRNRDLRGPVILGTVAERRVQPHERGLRATDLPDLAGVPIVGVARGRERCPFNQLAEFPLEPGDVVVHLTAAGRNRVEET